MATYRISVHGVAFVEAESAEEAEDAFWDGVSYREEYEVDEVVEVDYEAD